MAWTAANPVSVGNPTKKSHYDNLWDNVDLGRDTSDGAWLNTGLKIKDTGGDHDVTIKINEDQAANRILNLVLGASDRTITLSGNPTLGDWFDQPLKVASTPTLAGLLLTGGLELAGNSITGTSVNLNNIKLQQLNLIGATTISAAQWGYLGALTATGAEINTACDGIAATAAELNTGCDGISNPPIAGDATAGRVLRAAMVLINNATGAGEIKCALMNIFNGDVIANTDNIGKGETVDDWTLDATGSILKIEASGLTGNCVGCIAASVGRTGDGPIGADCQNLGADIQLSFFDHDNGGQYDLTAAVDVFAPIDVNIIYVTDA